MPNRKLKNESYQNFGGINSKVSPYQTGPQEFLDLTNFDFQTPGSLSQRWGSTQAVSGASLFGRVHTLFEFSKLNGASYLMAAHTGALWAIGTTFRGVSFNAVGATEGYLSAIYVQFSQFQEYRRVSFATGGGLQSAFAIPATVNGSAFDSVVFNDVAYLADGRNFLKYDGSTVMRFGVPAPNVGALSVAQILGATVGSATFLPGGLQSFIYALAFRNVHGAISPLAFGGYLTNSSTLTGASFVGGITLPFPPQGYGVTSILLYKTRGFTYTPTASQNPNDYDFYKAAEIPCGLTTIGGATFVVGVTSLFVDYYLDSSLTDLADPDTVFLTETGWSVISFTPGFGSTPSTASLAPGNWSGRVPRYLEIYSNRMAFSGFSALPSTVFLSEVGEPEKQRPETFFEVRTNDGDRVTAKKAYGQKLYIFKRNSFHALSGDSLDNFNLFEVSSEYGCVSNRAIAIYNDLLAFLDVKGVIRFNGAQIEVISNKIQPLIDRINFDAATDQATMVHDKSRNQLMLGVPMDGATINNVTLVYDYLVDAWTKYDGYNPSVYALAKGATTQSSVFYGGYSGSILRQGASFTADGGVGFTTYLKSRFLADLGQTVEKMHRRLYLNVDEASGATVSFNVNFFADYGSSVVLSRTPQWKGFQYRMDFGIPGKSMAFEMSKNSATTMIKFHGFGVDYRFLRSE